MAEALYLFYSTPRSSYPSERENTLLHQTDKNTEQENKRLEEKKKATEAPLFPNIEAKNTLPEKGTPTDFNHPSTVLTKITSKPVLPLPEVTEAQKNEPLVRFRQRISFAPEPPTAIEKQWLGTLNGIMVNAFITLYELRGLGQVDQLKVFEAANASIRANRAKERELIEEAHKNAKMQDTWSYARDLFDYFTAATGLLSGLAITTVGLNIGNESAVDAGLIATLGGAGTLGAHILRKYDFNNYATAALALAGSLLSGYGMYGGSTVIGNELPKILAQSLNIVTTVGETAISIKDQQAKAKNYEISAKLATSQFQRESDRATIQKQLGALKFSEASDFMTAASKLLAMQDEVCRRILQDTAV